MTILPANPGDSDSQVVQQLQNLITMDASILFVVLGMSPDAQKLCQLAVAQTNTGGIAGWVRKVVWLQRPQAIADPCLASYVAGVTPNDLGFTIGFSDKVGQIFHPGDSITAGQVFYAYAAAESQPTPGGNA